MIRKRTLGLWGFFLILCACEGLERNNPLDPRNPRSEQRRVTFVEAFVNDVTPFSPYALHALDSLSSTFPRNHFIIVEHHVSSPSLVDAHAVPESADRYAILATTARGVPDVIFNGSQFRLQGASSTRTASLRYRAALQTTSSAITHFTIAANKSVSATGIEINAAIARLGSTRFSQFAVLAVVWEDLTTAGHHRVVRKTFSPEIFGGIEAGETKFVRFAAGVPGVREAARLQAAVIIEQDNQTGKEVLQAALAE
ncbi:MAG: hypothetical protein ACREOO_31145 [bacterium]